MKNTVFIHTNAKQMVGAIASAYSLKRNSRNPDAFDVRITSREDFPFFNDFEGRKFLRAGGWRTWKNDDLQSFTPVRFMPPELMEYQGRAVVVDPDVFAVGDVNELLTRDMGGKAIMAKARKGHNGRDDYIASSVMLLDCAKLPHWNVRKQFEDMFAGKLDYEDWIILANEPRENIGFLESEWNDFDRLTSQTKLIHNTKRRTQPWKTGLQVDFLPVERFPLFPPFGWLMTARRKLLGDYALLGRYRRHPDSRQEALFWALLRETLDNGAFTEAFLRQEMARGHLRPDTFEKVASVPSVEAVLGGLGQRKAA